MSCLLKTLKHNVDHPRPIKVHNIQVTKQVSFLYYLVDSLSTIKIQDFLRCSNSGLMMLVTIDWFNKNTEILWIYFGVRCSFDNISIPDYLDFSSEKECIRCQNHEGCNWIPLDIFWCSLSKEGVLDASFFLLIFRNKRTFYIWKYTNCCLY